MKYLLMIQDTGIKARVEKDFETMKRNFLYLICGAVGVAIVIFGYQYYQNRQKSDGVEIKIDDNGISIQKN